MKLLIINGPNLNLLGFREPDIYGFPNYSALCDYIGKTCEAEGIEYKLFQSNHEGAIVDEIQAAYGTFDGIVINPAAYTHTSVAILDALKAVAIPTAEVHLSDINAREEFRHTSLLSPLAAGIVVGCGTDGYGMALRRIAGAVA